MKKTLAQLEPTDIVNIAFFAVLAWSIFQPCAVLSSKK